MANPISIGPEELLEQSLKIKKAARQLVEAHLNGLAKTLEPQTGHEDDEAKLQRIRDKNGDDRTAIEFLFLMNGLHKHSSSCSDIRCHWSQQCWRMKGLQYRTEKLRKKGVCSPITLAALWSRHMELEMHIETCLLNDCVCTSLEHYKYFLMRCNSELRNGRYVQISSRSEDPKPNLNNTLFSVIHFFKDHIEKGAKDAMENEKRSAHYILHKIVSMTFGDESELKEAADAKAAAEVAALAAAPAKLKQATMRECREKHPPGIIGGKTAIVPERDNQMSAAMVQRMAACSISSKRDFDPGQPGTSSGAKSMKKRVPPFSKPDKLWAGLTVPGCDHHSSRKCNCILNEEIVDLKLGERKILVRNRAYERRGAPSQAVVDELKRRVTILLNRRGTERRDLPFVRVLTTVVEGVKWTVAYTGEIHNLFSRDQFNSIVIQYMWAALYYPDVQVIMYNFVFEKHSEGATRLEAFLKEIPVQNVVTLNLKHEPKVLRGDCALQTKLAYKCRSAMQQLDDMKEGSTVWFSGCNVMLNQQSPVHAWRQTFKQDLDLFNRIINQHSRKVPPLPSELQCKKMMEANMDNLTPDQQFDLKLALSKMACDKRSPVSQLEYIKAATTSNGANSYVALSPTLYNASISGPSLASQLLETASGLHTSGAGETPAASVAGVQMNALFTIEQWTDEQMKTFIGGFMKEMIVQDNIGNEWIDQDHLQRLTGLTEFNFETEDAKEMLITKRLPRNVLGKAYVPDELVRMCRDHLSSHVQAAWANGVTDGARVTLNPTPIRTRSLQSRSALASLNQQREEIFGKIRVEEQRLLAARPTALPAELRLQFDVVESLIKGEKAEELTRLNLYRARDEFGSEDSMELPVDENIEALLGFRSRPLPPLKELKKTIKTHKKKNTNVNKKPKKK